MHLNFITTQKLVLRRRHMRLVTYVVLKIEIDADNDPSKNLIIVRVSQ